jgi:tRNA uridine 5-carbamoylmethylation protein Kti12
MVGSAVLLLICGLPAAGKTTLVKQLVAKSSAPSRLYERISFDDLYERLVAEDASTEFDPEKWKTCQQAMVVRVSTRLGQHNTAEVIGSGVMQQLVLLVDDSFQYRSLRKRFFHLATEREARAFIFKTSITVTDIVLVTCLQGTAALVSCV